MNTRNQKTKPAAERKVVELIALGTRYVDIYEETGVAVSTVKKIKRRNKPAIYHIQQELLHQQTQVAKRLRQKSLRLISDFLSDVEVGIKDASLAELVAVSKEMHRQSMQEPEPARIADSPERAQALLKAIQSGETTAELLLASK